MYYFEVEFCEVQKAVMSVVIDYRNMSITTATPKETSPKKKKIKGSTTENRGTFPKSSLNLSLESLRVGVILGVYEVV